ncbi:MAG: hypothetical protein ACREMV_00345 [Gemmatimonadales bacterium]
MRARYLILIPLVLVAACVRRSSDRVTPVLSSARVYYDDGPAFRDSVRLVVRDAETWQSIWSQATSTQASPPPLPAIDFGRHMVLVVGAGRMTPGDQIRVDSAGVRGRLFVAVVRTTLECRPFAADAYPLEIVRVARSDNPVSWVERRDRAAHCQ